MDVIGWLTAMYVALWIGVYKDDLKRDFGTTKPTEQTQQKEETK
jgi:hypothetical protein